MRTLCWEIFRIRHFTNCTIWILSHLSVHRYDHFPILKNQNFRFTREAQCENLSLFCPKIPSILIVTLRLIWAFTLLGSLMVWAIALMSHLDILNVLVISVLLSRPLSILSPSSDWVVTRIAVTSCFPLSPFPPLPIFGVIFFAYHAFIRLSLADGINSFWLIIFPSRIHIFCLFCTSCGGGRSSSWITMLVPQLMFLFWSHSGIDKGEITNMFAVLWVDVMFNLKMEYKL